MRTLFLVLFLVFTFPLFAHWSGEETRFFGGMPALSPGDPRQSVYFIHIDGLHSEVFKKMLEKGQLPHLEFLLHRARKSFVTSTVDKSETMKVILSYLTSQQESPVVGWWQFHRGNLRFRNFWIDPVEVANYALGFEFPSAPTLFDFFSHQDKTVMGGFNLHRRGVPFQNYARAYAEGLQAVFRHTYFDQAHATMNNTIDILNTLFRQNKNFPVFSTVLLAAADEFSHLEGVTALKPQPNPYCVSRKEKKVEVFFKLWDEDDKKGKTLKRLYERGFLFQKVKRNIWGAVQTICFDAPTIETYSEPSKNMQSSLGHSTEKVVAPHYVMALILVDLEIGRLMNILRQARFTSNEAYEFQPQWGNGLLNYVEQGRLENSLFENTLFMIFGDHGMVDTHHVMAPLSGGLPDQFRAEGSFEKPFLELLNDALGFRTVKEEKEISSDELLGMDDTLQPRVLLFPHKYKKWQSAAILRITAQAELEARKFFDSVISNLKDNIEEKYWWLLFFKKILRHLLIEGAVDDQTSAYREKIVDVLAKLYLQGNKKYLEAEQKMFRLFYNQQVRFIYGGGARNNAEFFMPAWKENRWQWVDETTGESFRPTYGVIKNFKGPSGKTLLSVLKENPGVGLIFIRNILNPENPQAGFAPAQILPETLEIMVMDRTQENLGKITAKKDSSGPLLFRYQVLEGNDPLGYLSPGESSEWWNFQAWNDFCVKNETYYHNVVAGLGTYFYSRNLSIGDIVIMHAQGWNFGDNGGGHGGVHREEKLTTLLVSGPGIQRGNLQYPEGDLFAKSSHSERAFPTLLDLVPTALHWLGKKEEFLDFAENDFHSYWRRWTQNQKQDVFNNIDKIKSVNEFLKNEDVPLNLSEIKQAFKQFLSFMPEEPQGLQDLKGYQFQGHVLDLE